MYLSKKIYIHPKKFTYIQKTAQDFMIEDPAKAIELKCLECAMEVADLDPNVLRSKEVENRVTHQYCKELREKPQLRNTSNKNFITASLSLSN